MLVVLSRIKNMEGYQNPKKAHIQVRDGTLHVPTKLK